MRLSERVVILRFKGDYEEVLKEFEDLYIECGEYYDCLIQMSYFMEFMDKSGVLE